jgi:hypothetical protein
VARTKNAALELDLPGRVYRTGRTYNARLELTNTSNTKIRFYSGSGQVFDLRVFGSDGARVYDWFDQWATTNFGNSQPPAPIPFAHLLAAHESTSALLAFRLQHPGSFTVRGYPLYPSKIWGGRGAPPPTGLPSQTPAVSIVVW